MIDACVAKCHPSYHILKCQKIEMVIKKNSLFVIFFSFHIFSYSLCYTHIQPFSFYLFTFFIPSSCFLSSYCDFPSIFLFAVLCLSCTHTHAHTVFVPISVFIFMSYSHTLFFCFHPSYIYLSLFSFCDYKSFYTYHFLHSLFCIFIFSNPYISYTFFSSLSLPHYMILISSLFFTLSYWLSLFLFLFTFTLPHFLTFNLTNFLFSFRFLFFFLFPFCFYSICYAKTSIQPSIKD